MRMFLISDNIDTQIGVRLAGVEGVVVHSGSEINDALDDALSKKDISIILLTEKLADLIPDRVNEIKLSDNRHLLTVIPDRHGSTRGKDYITSYVRDAIGVKF